MQSLDRLVDTLCGPVDRGEHVIERRGLGRPGLIPRVVGGRDLRQVVESAERQRTTRFERCLERLQGLRNAGERCPPLHLRLPFHHVVPTDHRLASRIGFRFDRLGVFRSGPPVRREPLAQLLSQADRVRFVTVRQSLLRRVPLVENLSATGGAAMSTLGHRLFPCDRLLFDLPRVPGEQLAATTFDVPQTCLQPVEQALLAAGVEQAGGSDRGIFHCDLSKSVSSTGGRSGVGRSS